MGFAVGSCKSATKWCDCDIHDSVWREISGTLTSTTYGMKAFPPKTFQHTLGSPTGGGGEGKITIGKLKCLTRGSNPKFEALDSVVQVRHAPPTLLDGPHRTTKEKTHCE